MLILKVLKSIFKLKKYFDIVTIIVFQCFHFDTTYILFFSLTILQSTGVYLKTENFDHFQYLSGFLYEQGIFWNVLKWD